MPVKYTSPNECAAVIDLDLGETNTFNLSEMNELIKIFEEKIEDRLDLKTVLIKSSNPDFFATGPSIKEIKNIGKDGARHYMSVLGRMISHIEDSPVPVICKIKGAVTGIGLDIASASDFRFASVDALFGDLTSKYGLVSPQYSFLRLSFLIGAQRAMEIITTGRGFSGVELYRFNYLTGVFNTDALDESVESFLTELTGLSTDSLRLKKKAFGDLWKNFSRNNTSPDDSFPELLKNGKDWKDLFQQAKDGSL